MAPYIMPPMTLITLPPANNASDGANVDDSTADDIDTDNVADDANDAIGAFDWWCCLVVMYGVFGVTSTAYRKKIKGTKSYIVSV